VRIPVANRVGEENDGWRVTMVTLSFERGTGFVGELLECMRLLGDCMTSGPASDSCRRRRPAEAHRSPGGGFRRAVGPHETQRAEAAQTGVPGIGARVFKLSFSEHAQALGDLAMEMLDTAALTADP